MHAVNLGPSPQRFQVVPVEAVEAVAEGREQDEVVLEEDKDEEGKLPVLVNVRVHDGCLEDVEGEVEEGEDDVKRREHAEGEEAGAEARRLLAVLVDKLVRVRFLHGVVLRAEPDEHEHDDHKREHRHAEEEDKLVPPVLRRRG